MFTRFRFGESELRAGKGLALAARLRGLATTSPHSCSRCFRVCYIQALLTVRRN